MFWLGCRTLLDVAAAVTDEVSGANNGVVLFHFGKEMFEVPTGDRIAELNCEQISYPETQEVEGLDDSKRGSGGFGSNGKS